MITLYRTGNSTVDYLCAQELSDYCGLKAAEVISFSVERLVIHELLVRVTSDLSVPDGPNYEDLGINLRSMVSAIYQRHVSPEIRLIQSQYDLQLAEAREYMKQQLHEQLFAKHKTDPETKNVSLLKKLFSAKAAPAKAAILSDPKEFQALACWQSELDRTSQSIHKHGLTALIKVVNALLTNRGRAGNDPDMILVVADNYASNLIGADVVSQLITPLFDAGVKAEGYRKLPLQKKPLVMNVKGASASGKSTIRPQQQQLADKLGIPWEDFALISPDYWRKYLLDYSTLGDDYKYAAMLTGQELELVDKKLDRYMAQKAEKGEIPHLLIDRFRFDSFSVENGRSDDNKLLSRFGDRIFMFFMVTSPEETVVRAWERGLTTGRFKAVDDLLYHNVEAYTGIPALFFSWVLFAGKQVHFEFLDNDVPKGQLPNTIAFGRGQCMTILNIDAMCNIDRFKEVNIEATNAAEVLVGNDHTAATAFLAKCISKIKQVQFADSKTAEVYAKFENGNILWIDENIFNRQDLSTQQKMLFDVSSGSADAIAHSIIEEEEKVLTLGNWGANR